MAQEKTVKKQKIDTNALENLKAHWEVYEMAVQGVRAWMGEHNNFSVEMILPGGELRQSYPTANIVNFLKDKKVLIDA